MGEQGITGRCGKPFYFTFQLTVCHFTEELGQWHDVFRAVAQGRHGYHILLQAIEQILPEPLFRYGFLQILVGCSHYPHVGCFVLLCTDGTVTAFLYGAEQHLLHLHC